MARGERGLDEAHALASRAGSEYFRRDTCAIQPPHLGHRLFANRPQRGERYAYTTPGAAA